jgi:iron complex outermembrane receptor protein
MGYEFNKANQSSAASYSAVMNQVAPGQGAVVSPLASSTNASLYNQSVYFMQRSPLTRIIDFAGGYRYQTQSASANGVSIWSGSANPNPSQTYSANAGDIAFNFKYREGQRIYIKWNQSYRFPNVDEFWGYSRSGGSPVFGGILKPQTAQTYELGGNWQLLKTNLTASVFSSVSQNEILYNPATFGNSNSPYDINRKGANLNLLTAITSKLSIGGGGTIQNAFYANGPYQNQSIAQVPNLLLNAKRKFETSGDAFIYIDLSNTFPTASTT